MKAKTKFLKMFYKLPEKARTELVYDAYGNKPMTLNIITLEVRGRTKSGNGEATNLGKEILRRLGYEDDKRITDQDTEGNRKRDMGQ